MIRNLVALTVIGLIATGIYWFGFRGGDHSPPAERKVLYYRDPMGGPDTSPAPKKDSMGMDYLPVYADEAQKSKERRVLHYKDPMGGPDISPVPKKDSMGMDYLPVYADEAQKPEAQKQQTSGRGRILYYRNPMGLADTSSAPKKDSMGMDYIPVYENDVSTPGTVQVDTAKLQRAGVRMEAAKVRNIANEIQAAGIVALDQTRAAVVAPRMEGWVERVYVGAVGLDVKAGQPLIEVYSPELVQLQEEYRLAREGGAASNESVATLADSALKRLQNLGISPAQIRDIGAGRYHRTLSLAAPTAGIVLKKNVVLGQRFMPGDQLYEIADISNVWVVAKVFEHDLPALRTGASVRIAVSALPNKPYEGKISFVAPQINPETRTADVRVNVANADGALRADMYAAVIIPASEAMPMVSVPNSAIIDSGTRQVVLVAKGEGRFEPRPVTLAGRSGGYTAIKEGLKEGEEIVVEATFLIDAESNLRAALQAFSPSPAAEAKP
ncbi:MAG: efflux RND transporter periplasmic adaptor subunit [Rhodospirillaceae bacterium]|nr:efflux RND transporter periplasmic adaptor subunit [Rhodospirillaceae bacterium]